MPRTLVTFLGKGRDNKETGYRKARYCFPDKVRESTYFGLALTDYLQPDTLVILGTSGSQWDLLVENLAAGDENQQERLELIDAVVSSHVGQELLERVKPLLEKCLGRRVLPLLIPFGKDEQEQAQILERVAESVPKGTVSFDLTHGFRHLGMVGFLSAFMLERIGKFQVDGLWYGALDMTENGETPVIRLDGLMKIRRWIDALDRFAANGDYSVFSSLLEEDGVPQDRVNHLRMAAYFESIHRVPDALRHLKSFLPVLSEPLQGASGLFQNKLRERLKWVQATSLEEHQRRLAYLHLNRGDFVRAAIFGWEAVVTKECVARGLNPEDYRNGRGEAEKQLKEELSKGKHEDRGDAYRTLRNLRNALAHGVAPRNREIRKLLEQPSKLRQELQACLQRLFAQ
jgi:CRISPR-associated Csx2 family protein